MMTTKVNKHLEGVLNLTEQMIKIADQGVSDDSVDNGFYILYGLIRDNAYEIRNATKKEYQTLNLEVPRNISRQPGNAC